MESHPSRDLGSLKTFWRRQLLGDIIPFWLRHAVDPEGGLNTCINSDGSLVSRDKWLWSQWRAVWVFSRLYDKIERDGRYLDLARQIYTFATRHGWDDQFGGWRLRLGADGSVQAGCDSIYVDGFAIYGATEFARVTGESEPADWARKTADAVLERLKQPPHRIASYPYPVPEGAKAHGFPMILSLVFWELGMLTGETKYKDAALGMQREILGQFYRPDRDMLLERVAVDGSEFPGVLGTAVVPGHVIEDMWFQIHIARDREDPNTIAECCRIMKRHCELGWDEQFGGLLLGIDANDGSEVGWDFADTKLWWPHTEAIYGLLLAYEQTGESWCLDWYDKVHAYAMTHYPCRDHGEWIQKLDRQGKPITTVVALPVKDPFHLPRALILSLETLERLT